MNNPKIIKFSDGSWNEYWLNDKGQFHRFDGPAIIEYFPSGVICGQRYYYLNYWFSTLKELQHYAKHQILS